MSHPFDVLWVNASPSLKVFDLPLQNFLSKYYKVARWDYIQTLDEASCFDTGVLLLYDFFLKSYTTQVHLIGHGISGVLALLFARQYPWRIRTLTLLGVAPQPGRTWHSYYYAQRRLFINSTREFILASCVSYLFGDNPPYSVKTIAGALAKDLEASPCMHSLLKTMAFPETGVSVPLMVCGSNNDSIVKAPDLLSWLEYLKPGDVIYQCSGGYHFFHYYHSQYIGKQILEFWQYKNF
jgi:pimeloyl-ACP methyl ester carboxylesterase